MATIALQTVVKAGLEPTYTAAAGGGDEFANPDGNRMYVLINASGGAIVATFVTQATTDGLAVADRPVTIPAGESRWVSDLDPNIYNDSSGNVQVTYDGVTSLTVGLFKMNGV